MQGWEKQTPQATTLLGLLPYRLALGCSQWPCPKLLLRPWEEPEWEGQGRPQQVQTGRA